MMGLQKPDKGRRGRLPRSEPDFPAPALCADANDMACFGKHVGDAARDCGGWIEPGDRPWGQSIELVKQKRIMGAAQHHDVGSCTSLGDKGRRDLAGYRFLVHRPRRWHGLRPMPRAWARQRG